MLLPYAGQSIVGSGSLLAFLPQQPESGMSWQPYGLPPRMPTPVVTLENDRKWKSASERQH